MKTLNGPLMDLIFVIVFVFGFSYLLGVYGPELDNPESGASLDAQTQAQIEYRKELAEAKMCREAHGESLVRHTADGATVCIPRGYIHRKTTK